MYKKQNNVFNVTINYIKSRRNLVCFRQDSTRVLKWRQSTIIIKTQNDQKIIQTFAYLCDLHFASTK